MGQTTVENSTLARHIRAQAARGALPHALIISGPGDRSGAARFAAAAMQCRAEEGKPCLLCSQCRRVLEDIHPDVLTVQARDTRELAVKAIRDLRSEIYIRPNDGARKVALFPDATQLNERDQNVLLKIVEEGPSYAAFIFCAENSAALLPTVRSRCVELKLQQDTQAAEPDMALLRAFASGRKTAVAEYMAALENRKLKREALHLLLRQTWQACAEALLVQKGKPAADPALQEAAALLDSSLSTKQLMALTDLMRRYAMESNYNVGVGHVLGAIAAEWESTI